MSKEASINRGFFFFEVSREKDVLTLKVDIQALNH